MGLSDVYTVIRGQILLMTLIPILSQCYAILLPDENQRDVHLTGINSSNVALNVRSTMPGKFAPKGSQSNPSIKKQSSDASLVCAYCHMQGHS